MFIGCSSFFYGFYSRICDSACTLVMKRILNSAIKRAKKDLLVKSKNYEKNRKCENPLGL